MNEVKTRPEFYVQNKIRCANLLLMYVLLFLLSMWLIPSPFGWLAVGLLLVTLLAIAVTPNLKQSVKNQTFDQIALRKFGVEYSSGAYGDEWLRPYNEFRVEYQLKKILFFDFYRVRLKHQVLDNLIIESTRSQEKAEKVVRALVDNTRLRLLK